MYRPFGATCHRRGRRVAQRERGRARGEVRTAPSTGASRTSRGVRCRGGAARGRRRGSPSPSGEGPAGGVARSTPASALESVAPGAPPGPQKARASPDAWATAAGWRSGSGEAVELGVARRCPEVDGHARGERLATLAAHRPLGEGDLVVGVGCQGVEGVTTAVSGPSQVTVTWVAGSILRALTTDCSSPDRLIEAEGDGLLGVDRLPVADVGGHHRQPARGAVAARERHHHHRRRQGRAAPKLAQIASRRGAPRGWRVCRGASTVRASAISRARSTGLNLGSRSGSGRLSRTR